MNPSVDFSDQVAIAAVVSYVIEALKRWHKFPAMSPATDWLNRTVAWIINIAMQIGIGVAWSGDMWNGGTLTVTVPSIWAVWTLVKGLAVQEGWYRAAMKKREPVERKQVEEAMVVVPKTEAAVA